MNNAAGDALMGCAAGTAGAAAAIIGGAAIVAAVGTEAAVAGAGVVAAGAGAAIESEAGDGTTSIATDVVAVIGRLLDTESFQNSAGYEVLNRPDWTSEINDSWVQSVIDRGLKVYMASADTADNMVNESGGEPQFFIEIKQFLAAGYTKVGDYLIPPGGTP